jgi:carbon storage regulator
MLVLTRRVGEEIVIDGNIRVIVLESQHGRIRIGIDAPDSVRVDRREVHTRRQSPNKAAAPAALVGAT